MRKPSFFQSQLFQSIACTAVFAAILGVVVSCGGGSNLGTIMNPAGAAIARIANHPTGHASIYPHSTSGAFLAALFQTSGTTGSQLPESFEGTCDVTGISAAVLDTGFTVLNVPNGTQCSPTSVNVVGAVGGAGNAGISVALGGTITVLKVSVVTQANQRLRCIVTNGTAAVNDNDTIQPYYNFSTNTAVLGIGSNQLPVSCQVPVAAGDQAVKIAVEWSKT